LYINLIRNIYIYIYIGLFAWYPSKKYANRTIQYNNEIFWTRNYAALLKYGEEYGTCNVPTKFYYECILPGMGEDGSDYEYKGKLGQWLSNQKSAKNTCKLGPEREAQLQILVDKGKYYTSMIHNINII
jgi:hypothetical protein